MKYVETVPPTSEPISYAEAKAQIRLDDDIDQLYVCNLIIAARFYAERVMNISLVSRTIAVTHYGNNTPALPMTSYVSLPRGPVQSIASVVDTNGNTISSSNYELRRIGTIDYCYFINSPSYPITITYTAGYGTPAQVPMHIKAGMLMHVAHLFYTREAVVDGQQVSVAHGLDAIYGIAGTGESLI